MTLKMIAMLNEGEDFDHVGDMRCYDDYGWAPNMNFASCDPED